MLAASSLTDVLEDLAAHFHRDHPEVRVVLGFAGSQTLRFQIEQGAETDVYASASPEHVDALEAAGYIESRQPLSTDEVVVAVSADSPIRDLAGLAQVERFVLGVEAVPIGHYGREVLAKMPKPLALAIERRVVSLELNVRAIRAKLALGEADAAFLYASDVRDAQPGLRSFRLPEPLRVKARHELGVLHPKRPEVRAWVEYLISDAADEVFEAHGLGRPE